MNSVQFKSECNQLLEMATAFRVRQLGAALVVNCNSTGFWDRRSELASFPSLPQYRSGLPNCYRAQAPQRLRRSDLCTRFNNLKHVQIEPEQQLIAERHQTLGMRHRAFRQREQVSIHMCETGEQNFSEIYIPIKISSVNFSGYESTRFKQLIIFSSNLHTLHLMILEFLS